VKLFDDQADMIERTVQSLRKGHKSVLMQYPTGGGKSVMATEIVRRAVAKGNNVWFTVPRRELIRQMGQTFQDFDLPYGLMAAGHRYRPDRAAYVCSTDTLKSRLASFTPPKLAVIDETHFGGEGWIASSNGSRQEVRPSLACPPRLGSYQGRGLVAGMMIWSSAHPCASL